MGGADRELHGLMQAIGQSGGNRHHILDGATDLDAYRVVGCVDPQVVAVKQLDRLIAKGRIDARRDQRRSLRAEFAGSHIDTVACRCGFLCRQ